ncbi:major facilitator superfamily domain-containing protein [Gymnopilus junonius]|uniref:Major facilitator superfamily domain-containing protein n=1 Tax=Gymnopilus junonius TaxID=109634 RepID=A0A9P5ND02_GYMJU|nr:major facilitator superfamily domain-containing protein [Gymnopilus junonius]
MTSNDKEASIEKGIGPYLETQAEDLTELNTESGVNRAYELKCHLILPATLFEPSITDTFCIRIGFGRYQIELFVLTGFGWMADNIWLQGVAIVLPQVQQELNPVRVEFATLALYVGLIIGASLWGVLADLIGRRVSFNITLFLAGVFGIASAGSPNFTTFGALVACLGFGVGGKMISGALYLEHIPGSYQWTLTLLSAWWAIGQLVASVVAWGFIGNFSCASDVPVGQCPKAENMGWRYTLRLGALTLLMFICRFFIFNLQESPKYLIANGRDEEAIKVMEHLARKNGKSISLTLDQLQEIQGSATLPLRTMLQVVKESFSHLSLSHVKPLFAGRKLAINSSITILLWGLIGLAYPLFSAFLPFYLRDRVPSGNSAVSVTYRNYTIVSVLGIPGSLIACAVVDWTRRSGKYSFGGRKLVMAVSTTLTGIFLFLFTTSNSQAAVLGYTCTTSVTSYMYGVLYAYTPEVFPAPHRGTGDSIASSFNRITGILSPVIKIATTSAVGALVPTRTGQPIFVSASLFLVAALLMLFLPIETAGKAAL